MPSLRIAFARWFSTVFSERWRIAAILHLSEKTVENHRANAMRKLGMRDRVELVRYAIRRGLIEP